MNYKELNELPEVIYASPFVKASENGEWFPMTNCCYLGYYGGMDNLIKLLSTYKVEVLGELFYFDNIYAIFCTKESIGHALEVANILYESGIFYFAEPDFLSLTLD